GHRAYHAHARQGVARPSAGARVLHAHGRRAGARGDQARARSRDPVSPQTNREPDSTPARPRIAVSLRRKRGSPGSARAHSARARGRAAGQKTRGPFVNGSAVEIAAALKARQSFIVTSHARPDGDAIGSALALAFALQAPA